MATPEQEKIMERAEEIGKLSAYPNWEKGGPSGMTYRQWIIAEMAASMVGNGHSALSAIETADELLYHIAESEGVPITRRLRKIL